MQNTGLSQKTCEHRCVCVRKAERQRQRERERLGYDGDVVTGATNLFVLMYSVFAPVLLDPSIV